MPGTAIYSILTFDSFTGNENRFSRFSGKFFELPLHVPRFRFFWKHFDSRVQRKVTDTSKGSWNAIMTECKDTLIVNMKVMKDDSKKYSRVSIFDEYWKTYSIWRWFEAKLMSSTNSRKIAIDQVQFNLPESLILRESNWLSFLQLYRLNVYYCKLTFAAVWSWQFEARV